MQNITFETAQRLKAAGFPQPEPEFGQHWFVMWGVWQIGVVGFIANRAWQDGLIRVAIESEAEKIYSKKQFENFVFAPSAPDILAEVFPERKCVSFGAMDLLVMALDPETAALAYIELKQK